MAFLFLAVHGMSIDPDLSADPTGPILDWLSGQPAADLAAEALALGQQLDALHSPTISSQQFHHCIELFYGRALRLCLEHRQALRREALPLPAALLNRARQIAEVLKRVAQGFERVLTDADARAGTPQKRLNETASARALRLLGENYLTLGQAGLDPEPEAWRIAWRLYAMSRSEAGALEQAASPVETALYAYKRLLAMASLEPQSLSPAELDWAAEYLARISGQVHVQEIRPPALDGAWYWLDPYGSAEPQACVRRDAPEGRSLLYFSTTGLARRAGEQLARHESGRTGGDLDLHPDFPDVHPATLLERLRSRWATPPRREQPRRRQEYTVQACVGLTAIWTVLRHGDDPALVSEWGVVNESPGGYAIMTLQGRSSGLLAGMAIALRRDVSDIWSLCVVRWIRSDAVNQIEIGLQMLSRGAIPIQVGFKGSEREAGMVRALVLPVLPALRQHQAVLAPAGTYISRRFSLVSDIDRLYVAQCRLLSLDLQTSNVELFQFEVDPYPI
ncbi:hypothetical protein HJ583_015725 [Uliginosibacterium sp. IMCC34675]|uniref:Uncharacterized protein n=2 Tax=Uliginosibacterium aquaticum TaxID=2731212 RepID=A0ABX2IJK6_9RHOO|nr:hypothetical protein [Uliginosibacterium aquaticum]